MAEYFRSLLRRVAMKAADRHGTSNHKTSHHRQFFYQPFTGRRIEILAYVPLVDQLDFSFVLFENVFFVSSYER